MSLPVIAPIIETIGTILDRLIPDKNAAAKAKAQLATLEIQGELQNALAQIEVNKEASSHPSIFVAGARPFILWVCGSVFAYHYLLYPIIKTLAALNGWDVSVLPEFDLGTMMPILGGLLGLGTMRTVEKIKGVARDNLK